jgi:hypothetical protein
MMVTEKPIILHVRSRHVIAACAFFAARGASIEKVEDPSPYIDAAVAIHLGDCERYRERVPLSPFDRIDRDIWQKLWDALRGTDGET